MTAPHTVEAAFSAAARRLARAGIAGARLDARVLVGHALGTGGAAVPGRPRRGLTADERRRLAALVARRARREPLAHVVGSREFWSLPFAVTADVLVPRPDSETVVEAALGRVRDRDAPLTVLDLGTGSGCLVLALLSELPRGLGVGVDISAAALEVARRNARALGLEGRVRLVRGDWGAGLRGPFQVIVANPPYVPDGDLGALEPEVSAFEPRLALAGGADGLDGHRAVAPWLAGLLAPAGAVFLEIGAGQGPAVAEIVRRHGLQHVETMCDLAGIPRCLVAVPRTRRNGRKKGLESGAIPATVDPG